MSVGLQITIDGLERALGVINRLEDAPSEELMTIIGAEGENQTRRRIESEKTAPDGSAWKPNRHGGSILLASGNNLRDSVAYQVTGATSVEWGASWEYAHVHQNGMVIKPRNAKRLAFGLGGDRVFARQVTIPPRPFVGLSDANAKEIVDTVTDFLGLIGRGG